MRPKLIAGLDIGTTNTCAVIGETVGDPRRPGLTILGVGQTRTEGLRGDMVTNIEEITESVRASMKEAELMAGVSVDRVYAGIGGDYVRAWNSMGVVAISEDEVSRDDMERVHIVARAVALPADREMVHAIPQEYRVDDQQGIKDPLGMAGVRLEAEVFLVTCQIAGSTNIRKAVNQAGYCVQEMVLEPLAGGRAVLTEDEKAYETKWFEASQNLIPTTLAFVESRLDLNELQIELDFILFLTTLAEIYRVLKNNGKLIFSYHGLPKKYVDNKLACINNGTFLQGKLPGYT